MNTKEAIQNLDHELGGINVQNEVINSISTMLGHVADKVINTEFTDRTSAALTLYDIKDEIIVMSELIRYTNNNLHEAHDKADALKQFLFDKHVRGNETELKEAK